MTDQELLVELAARNGQILVQRDKLRKELEAARKVIEAARFKVTLAPRGLLGYLIKTEDAAKLSLALCDYDDLKRKE